MLVVGHSSGAHLGVSILADLVRAGRVPTPGTGPALGFLTLGQVVPMVSFLPRAGRLRADLACLSVRDEITWVDVTAPGDGCAFALCDPVAVSGVAPAGKRWPLVLSAAFTRTLSPARWKALRWRFFRLHFQYLCAFDRPGDYDYFRITAGPMTWPPAMPTGRRRNRGSTWRHRNSPRWRPEDPMPEPAPKTRGAARQGVAEAVRETVSGDILSAQPEKLYRAWMAEFRTPFFRSYLANDPKLVSTVLKDRPDDFPKSDRVGAGLAPILGQSVFLTNGALWKRQRRIIDPPSRAAASATPFPRCGRPPRPLSPGWRRAPVRRSMSRPRPAMPPRT